MKANAASSGNTAFVRGILAPGYIQPGRVFEHGASSWGI